MKIAFLCPRFLWAGGGSVLLTERLAAAMTERGHAVTIFADEPAERKPTPDALAFHGGTVRTLPRNAAAETRAKRRLAWADVRGGYRISKWLFRSGRTQLTASGPVCDALRDPETLRGFDAVVLVNSSSAWTVLLAEAMAALDKKRRIVIPLFHPHETMSRFPVMPRLHRGFEVICGLTAYEKRLVEQPGWPSARFVAIGAGSDMPEAAVSPTAFRERHGIPAEAPLVLFAGRKIYNKGVTHVVEAMDAIWEKRPDARLALIGFSHNPPEWLEAYLARSPHAPERTVNLDDVSHAEREEALAACTLLAAPSISDSFGIVYLDAWRHQKPVIACRDTCCETFIDHGENGLLIGFENPGECAAAMASILDDPETARRLGEAGYATWDTQFRWEHVADRFESALSDPVTSSDS